MAYENEYPTIIPIYMQLWVYSNNCSIKFWDKNSSHIFPCSTLKLLILLSRSILIAILFQVLLNIIQAILYRRMYENRLPHTLHALHSLHADMQVTIWHHGLNRGFGSVHGRGWSERVVLKKFYNGEVGEVVQKTVKFLNPPTSSDSVPTSGNGSSISAVQVGHLFSVLHHCLF